MQAKTIVFVATSMLFLAYGAIAQKAPIMALTPTR